MAKVAATKPPTKTEILTNIAEATGLTKKQVQAVFDAMTAAISESVGKKGPGAFTIPGLCKIVRQNKPALPKRMVRNPATGEMVEAAAKPARNVVKVRALKALKDMV
ncbi:MAG: HU family DNA-binding protein [Planctomycetia bacterium]|nr:HU family DNA-binding protein [Planctomycetia bacterium]